MTNENLMEEVMYKAHSEGIVREVQELAKDLRDNKRVDFYNSYIEAYYKISRDQNQVNLDLT